MKILLVSQYYYPERFKVTELAEELFHHGIEVDVLTGLPNYPEGNVLPEYKNGKNRYQTINGINIIRVPLIGRRTGWFFLTLNYISFAFNSSIRALFMKRKYDLVLVYQLSPIFMALPAILIKWLHSIPLVIYTFDLWPDSISTFGIKENSFFYKVIRWSSRGIYKRAVIQWVSSELFAEYLEGFTKQGKNIVYLPQYADDQFDLPQKEPQDEFVCLFAGNMGKAHNLDKIILAAKRLESYSKIKFEFVGQGSDFNRIVQLSEQLGLSNIHFAGAHPFKEMPEFYSMADLFLVTLINDPVVSLAFPEKVQTYMASRRPVVGAVGGETSHVINESHGGICVSSGDDSGLANAILTYYQDRGRAKRDGLNARAYYDEHFTKKKFYDTILINIEKVSKWRKENV